MPQEKKNLSRKIFVILASLAILALIGYGVYVAIVRNSIPNFSDGNEYSVVKLTTNSGVSYEWFVDIDDSAIAEITDKTSTERDENLVGGIIDLEWKIKGKKAGRTKIHFRYGSVFDGDIQKEVTYQIEVNDKLESRIKEL